MAAKADRLVGFLRSERRLELAAELPESILKDLWAGDAPVLLVPKGVEPESPGEASPDEADLAAWLEVLDRALDSPENEEAHQPIPRAVQSLLQTLSAEDRARFLRKHQALRIIRVREAGSGVEKPAAVEYLERLWGIGCLFTFAGGLREARMGIAPLLARAMPGADVCLVRAQTYRDLLSEDEAQGSGSRLPAASDGRACLATVGRYTGHLGDLAGRHRLLERASDPGTDADARRGLRFLLHGSLDHRDDDDAKLWIGRHDQHHPWDRLWDMMHGAARWSRVEEKLADAIPRNRWGYANIAETDARTLIDELLETGQGVDAPEELSVDERDEILSRIDDQDLWLRLHLHTTLEGIPVSAAHERVYLAPRTGGHEEPLIREATLIAPSQNEIVANQQRRWLSPLDDRARIEIVLGTAEPVCYWRDVMLGPRRSATAAAVRTPLPPPGSRTRSASSGSRTWSMDAMKRATPTGVKNCPRAARRLESAAGRPGRSGRSRSRRSRKFDAVTVGQPSPPGRGVWRVFIPLAAVEARTAATPSAAGCSRPSASLLRSS